MTNMIENIGYSCSTVEPPALDRLLGIFADFNRFEEQVPLPYLVDRLRGVPLKCSDVAEYVSFGEAFYRRNLLYEGNAFRALILCWSSGQRSPIHNHSGSHCFVKIIKGTATEIQFAQSGCGLLFPNRIRELREDESCTCRDLEMHQMGNLQPDGQDLVTLHVYSPPLQHMELFSLNESVFADHEKLVTLARCTGQIQTDVTSR